MQPQFILVHFIHEFMAACVDLGVILNFVSPIMHLSFSFLAFHVNMGLYWPLHVCHLFLVYRVHLHHRSKFVNSFRFYNSITWTFFYNSEYVRVKYWSTAGFLDKLINNIPNVTFRRISSTPGAASVLCVGLAISIWLAVTRTR